MPTFKKIYIPEIKTYYDPNLTYGYITVDRKYKRTSFIVYISVKADHDIKFANIETTAFRDSNDAKVLREYYREILKDDKKIEKFKKAVINKYKDWRNIRYSSKFTFQGKRVPGAKAHTEYYKFDLPGIDHKISKFESYIAPSSIT